MQKVKENSLKDAVKKQNQVSNQLSIPPPLHPLHPPPTPSTPSTPPLPPCPTLTQTNNTPCKVSEDRISGLSATPTRQRLVDYNLPGRL